MAVLALARPAAGDTHAPPPDGPRYLVKFVAGADEEARRAALASVGAVVDVELAALGIVRVVVPAGPEEVPGAEHAALETLLAHPAVARAEPDREVRIALDPNDTYWSNDPYTGLGQWAVRKIAVDRAWDFVTADASIIVAIVDTGVDPAHPDLVDALVAGNTFVSQPSPDCQSGTTRDDSSHGTHVAGVVGATAQNGMGVAGVAHGVRLMPIKVLDCTGTGTMSDVAQGIIWATDNGARIVNISLGTPSDTGTLRDAVRYAHGRGVLVVASSGNCGLGPSDRCATADQIEYPAGYPEAVSVAAVDEEDLRASFSSANSSVDVSAPGRRILSTTPGYDTYLSRRTTNAATLHYAQFSGTSQAAPHVAGVAALIWSREPALTPDQVAQRLRDTALDLGDPGHDIAYGAGRLDGLAAVAGEDGIFGARYRVVSSPEAAPRGETFTVSLEVTNTSSFTWPAAGPTPVRASYHWSDAGGRIVIWDGVRTSLPTDVAPGATVTLEVAVLAPPLEGSHLLRLDLVQDGVAWFSDRGVAPAPVPVLLNAGYGATYAPAAGAATITLGLPQSLLVEVRNTGTRTWSASGPAPVRLSYHWYTTAGALAVWDGRRGVLPHDLAPGASVTVELPLEPPPVAGEHLLRLDLVHEGVTWFSGEGVAPHELRYRVDTGYAASYVVGTVPQLLPGGRVAVPVTITNTGPLAWPAGGESPVRLASHVADRNTGTVLIWDGERTPLAADVPAGGGVETVVIVDAPRVPGTYRLRVDLVREGVAWFSGLGVASGDVTFNVVADHRASLTTGPLTVSVASPAAEVTITNTSAALLNASGAVPVRIAAHWLDASGAVLVWDGPRTALPADLRPGESLTVRVALGPPPPGASQVVIDLVAEGVRWFGAGQARPVTLVP